MRRMEITVLKLLLQYGTAPALILLCVLILLFNKEIGRRIEGLENTFKELKNKTDFIEQSYVRKEDLYRDISGWRGDVKTLFTKIDNLREEFFYLKGRYEELKDKKNEEF